MLEVSIFEVHVTQVPDVLGNLVPVVRVPLMLLRELRSQALLAIVSAFPVTPRTRRWTRCRTY
ncbi:MAG: hypothetical protein WD273_08075 [Trueperaceae bacterium]